MSNQELCTQYEFIVSMIENGNADKVVEILKNAIKRIDKNTTTSSQDNDRSDD